jgi:ABC-type molybdate transport system substrate-binding protein
MMLLRKLLPGSLTAIIPLLCFCASAQADDIKVLASVALTTALDDLAPVYEKKPRTS